MTDSPTMTVAPKKNITRAWRPQRFSDVVGQEIALSMLQNSLHCGHLFPAYLFAGQKGCGKTSLARIFAAALNCEAELPANRPCTTCSSCIALHAGSHPDCIEIDAASHTGVDDIRSILQTASFLPLSGRKKLYLIDEAHMLSKAAFNALLKILEEPPLNTIFMLATTEIEKIPGTIRSRSFHLPFGPLPRPQMEAHLRHLCTVERIPYEEEGLSLLVENLDGSIRDAQNAIEQIRFAAGAITVAAVKKITGIFEIHDMAAILHAALTTDASGVITQLQRHPLTPYTPEKIWLTLLTTLRTLTLALYGVSLPDEELRPLTALISACTLARGQEILELIWMSEEAFLATPHKHLYLEHLLIRIARAEKVTRTTGFSDPTERAAGSPRLSPRDDGGGSTEKRTAPAPKPNTHHTPHATVSAASKSTPTPSTTPSRAASAPLAPTVVIASETESIATSTLAVIASEAEAIQTHNQNTSSESATPLERILTGLAAHPQDAMLLSILQQARVISCEPASQTLTLALGQENAFLRELITEKRTRLAAFAAPYTLRWESGSSSHTTSQRPRPSIAEKAPARGPVARTTTTQSLPGDAEEWPVTHDIIAHLGGKLERHS